MVKKLGGHSVGRALSVGGHSGAGHSVGRALSREGTWSRGHSGGALGGSIEIVHDVRNFFSVIY